ncbi:hypothetical protein L249_2067 [Ophiocordyceps polyrhachis-furcata BCC 54312]|uniref:Uncharacterized protein n=1 Tax=Ophiocordyceps polyrhachis-furcata BCC 54312 TaxID=1330021 RepID=A0A367LR88_9HYPO|nr:hypothetical protein L249_2067 [Ophiocordyceps polyrhachis-furcata BCC 54312]
MNGTHACHSFDVRQQNQGSAVIERPVEAGKPRCQGGRSVVPLKILTVPCREGPSAAPTIGRAIETGRKSWRQVASFADASTELLIVSIHLVVAINVGIVPSFFLFVSLSIPHDIPEKESRTGKKWALKMPISDRFR